MSARLLLTAGLALAGASVVLGSALALLAVRSPADRLHVVSPAATLGVALVTAAAVISEGVGAASAKSLLVALVIFATNPLVTHAMGRAIRVRRYGSLRARRSERRDRP